MAKFVKVILFLLFAVAFFSAINNSSADKVGFNTYAVAIMSEVPKSTVSSSPSPYLPEAEVANSYSLTNQVLMSRIQRTNLIEYSLSLKEVQQHLASYVASLSQHRERIYDTTTSYYCHPSSEYYVFALRRIIV